ncbi:hypothetical protein DUNSADRAFT_280 [Dunaliella salina]|uniref:Encoded protein n=1 Tax=Dunaliella salina TaxID=3046 RepID=A0ABQ7GYE8_DUNSA|nr:hypothetical protein DUNSADRAFT_280 [Dunaliella salina]|eukprot:KAF5839625.1 hypothetical protein DUNSADRAFT_280 [Dunaliella salina]
MAQGQMLYKHNPRCVCGLCSGYWFLVRCKKKNLYLIASFQGTSCSWAGLQHNLCFGVICDSFLFLSLVSWQAPLSSGLC